MSIGMNHAMKHNLQGDDCDTYKVAFYETLKALMAE
jgi:hypothetical protein